MPGLVLLAAGGTGGHLFPAEALATVLATRGWRVHLASDRRVAAYEDAFPADAIHAVSAGTVTGSPVAAAGGLARLAWGVVAARGLVRRLKPAVVAGFGGYPTVPPVLAAAWAGIPTLIHEQNAVLGRSNRFLAPRVRRIATSVAAVEGAGRFTDRVVETGNPVRQAARAAAATAYPERSADDPFRLTVFGGSQGARFLSDLVPAAIAVLPEGVRERLQVVQQCRPEDMDRVEADYGAIGMAATLAPFFADLPQRIAESHLVVCRSGASTCAELAVIGRPAIMVPLPHALDQDQKANATVLARAGGGWMVEQADMSPERLASDLGKAIAAPDRLAAVAAAARRLGRPDAAERLADLVATLARVEPVAAGQGDET